MTSDTLQYCQKNISLMLKRSQTKVIFPLITWGLLRVYQETSKAQFSNNEIKFAYENSVRAIIDYLGYDLHVGGKYYDAYPSRNLPKYGVLHNIGLNSYQLEQQYIAEASILLNWIPEQIKRHIEEKLGIIPKLKNRSFRVVLSDNKKEFLSFIKEHINRNPTNFEIFSFAVIKIHLEKFACKIYRDSRTSANDNGIDLSTNFGVVYQIKKLKVTSQAIADTIYTELSSNFDTARLQDGNIVLIIDDISKDIKQYLISMKIQSLTTQDILQLSEQFEEEEDREKVLRIIFDEFRREYSSDIK